LIDRPSRLLLGLPLPSEGTASIFCGAASYRRANDQLGIFAPVIGGYPLMMKRLAATTRAQQNRLAAIGRRNAFFDDQGHADYPISLRISLRAKFIESISL
jgi:hypothetical protein